MNHASRRANGRRLTLSVDSLEGRALLSGVGGVAASLVASRAPASVVGSVGTNAIKTDPVAISIITQALAGRGPAADFGALLRGQIGNLSSLIRGFTTGMRTQFTSPGIAIKIPKWQEAYAGPHFDHLTATAAGAVYTQRTGQLQLGAVMRGLFDENVPSQVVFGLNRGAGARIGPAFASRPGITPDLIVTVTVAPNGSSATGTIKDLVTGAETAMDPSKILVSGATVRVFLSSSQIPGQGFRIPQYRFAAWTRHGDGSAAYGGTGIGTVGSFVPESTMVPIGVKAR